MKTRNAFTLIEVLIVVVIMAVLAATIIPQFSTATSDAKTSSIAMNLQSIRQQIEMYKVHHNGAVPVLASGALPGLTGTSDATGALGTGAAFPYGPYLQGQLPPNALNNKNVVIATAVFPPTASTTDGGWLYDAATGQIAPNSDGHLND